LLGTLNVDLVATPSLGCKAEYQEQFCCAAKLLLHWLGIKTDSGGPWTDCTPLCCLLAHSLLLLELLCALQIYVCAVQVTSS